MSNIADKSIAVIPVAHDINDNEVDNLESEQSEQGNNQQSGKEAEKQDDGVVTLNDDEVTSIQHSSKDGGDEECENPEDIEVKTETLTIDKEKESMKQNENQASSKDNIDKHAEGDTRSVVDAQDCNDETNKILFGDTQLKHLKKVKVDKGQFK